MVLRNSQLGAYIAEYSQLLLVFSAHAFFLSVCAVETREFSGTGSASAGRARKSSLDNGEAYSKITAVLTRIARIAVRVLLALRNSVAIEPADKLVYILVGLESMLLRSENEPLAKNVGERLAFLIGESKEKRIAVKNNVVEIYSHRSGFIHHGRSI